LKFEWHNMKAAANKLKHGISFDEAATVFADTLAFVFSDQDHLEDETRFLIIGMSETGRILVVSHTD